MASFWEEQRKIAIRKQLYEASRLAATKNPDYVNLHADEVREFNTTNNSISAEKRIRKNMQHVIERIPPPAFPARVRMSRR